VKAVVIGGTGFLGLNLVEALLASGHEVVATRRGSSNTIFLRRFKVPMRAASLDEVDSLVAAMQGSEVAFFAAAHYPRLSIDTEAQVARAVAQGRNVLEAARRAGVRRLVYTGSVVTVARPKADRPAVEADGVPASAPQGSTYYAVKLALQREIHAARGLEIVELLPTGCFGPYDHKVGTGFFVVAVAHGKLAAFVDGKINVVDVRDVARAHVAAAREGRPGERYILGGHDVVVSDFLSRISRCLGVPMAARKLGAQEALELATAEEARCQGTPERPALSREIVDMAVWGQFVDSGKARAELGFAPRPLAATLADSVDWYRRNGYIPKTS
jgi:dihydroflavonol-4-reductase